MSARLALAAAMALIATPAAAQDASQLADRFERALVAGDYRDLPLTEDFTYTENGARLDPWDGMWRTLTAVEGAVDHPELDYRLAMEWQDKVVRVVEFDENTVHGVMAYLLQVRDGQIASVDVLPIREEFGGDRGGTLTLLQPMLPFTMDGELVGAIDPTLTSPAQFGGAEAEARMAAYLGDPGSDPGLVTFSPDCIRRDNGRQSTGVADSPLLDPAVPGFRPYALSCEEQFRSGFFSNLTLDGYNGFGSEELGLLVVFARLDQSGTQLSFTTPDGTQIAYPGPRGAVQGANTGEQFDGRILSNMITPMSVNGVYIFKFDADGAISRIEAFYRGAPLGWDAVPD
ncbi:MAG: hypothetical protein KDE15_08660 [Erythrobacter sp.]|nr:hypothetical protein [Erythrobacter sp.]